MSSKWASQKHGRTKPPFNTSHCPTPLTFRPLFTNISMWAPYLGTSFLKRASAGARITPPCPAEVPIDTGQLIGSLWPSHHAWAFHHLRSLSLDSLVHGWTVDEDRSYPKSWIHSSAGETLSLVSCRGNQGSLSQFLWSFAARSLLCHENHPQDEPMVHPKLNSASGVFELLTLLTQGRKPHPPQSQPRH